MKPTTSDLDALMQVAKASAEQAYAPYSKYRVGSAVLTDKGVFAGFNIENASTPLGICAERAAMTHARINGATVIHAVAICCLDATVDQSASALNPETMPCGACRQWMAELAPNALIVTNGSNRVFTVDDLLPNAFRLPD